MSKKYLLSVLFLTSIVFSQDNRKTIQIQKITDEVTVDGELNEAIWSKLTVLNDFVQFVPVNGKPASQKTEAHVCYDDQAIYVAGVMFDTSPDSILKEIGQRDSQDGVNTDLFSLHISPYNDGINSVYFMVSAAGVQTDRKYSSSGADNTWDAVWESAVKLTDYGWVAEIKIPYSALRFSDADVQNWGFNVFRHIKRYDEWNNWSFVSNELEQWWQHYGLIEGLENIDSPLRLSFSPYFSSYMEKNASKSWDSKFNGGMDLKYGISESFTLDMTLVPDFGQVQSDDQQLNLTPFEIQYNERRQFFTEGTELFSKGYIFYSRRIGSTPKWINRAYSNLTQDEIVTTNPIETKLLNATKLSGRTESGLGIGFLNAMTQQSEAIVLDTITHQERRVVTQPFTNYNIFVLDQTFSNNSFVSLINSNTAMKDYIGNVTATQFRAMENSNTFGILGDGAVSYQKEKDKDAVKGYRYYLELGKLNGTFQYRYAALVTSEKYDHNDLGYLSRNNEIKHELALNYNILTPFSVFRKLNQELKLGYSRRVEPSDFTEFRLDYEVSASFINFYNISMHAAWIPVEGKNYYEPRVNGRYLKSYKMLHNCMHGETDQRENLYFEYGAGYTASYDYDFAFNSWWYDITPNYRFSDKFSLAYDFFYSQVNNEPGFVSYSGSTGNIYFGKRERITFTNTVAASYIFNSTASLSFRLRHYWAKASYDTYYLLTENGDLLPVTDYTNNHDVNYNAFNIDMTFRWIFAPGSELVVNYKNAIYSENEQLENNFWDNLSHTFDQPQINSLSVKFLYYLDYINIF